MKAIRRAGNCRWVLALAQAGGGPIAVALMAVVLSASVAVAADGQIQWQTLRTEHADIHFPGPYRAFAQRVAAIIADASRHIEPLFNDRPRPRLQLTIDDYSDDANGYAQTLPYNQVHLQAYPPDPSADLGDHGDWLRALIFHEYAHILHLGDVSGPPMWLNAVLGRQFLPNIALPRLLTEGIATWVETRHTGSEVAVQGRGGRIESPQFLALLRAAVRDDTLPKSLSELTGVPLVWPRANSWYLYGSLLVDDLISRYGQSALRVFMGHYGRQIIPYGIHGIARKAWGASLEHLWQQARATAVARIEAQWRAQAVQLGLPADATLGAVEQAADGERLTRDGNWRGRMRATPDGRAAVVAHSPRDGLRRIERIDHATGQVTVVHHCSLDCDDPLVSADGKWLLYTESRPFERLYSYRELIAVPLASPASAKGKTLTRGLRGRSIALWLAPPVPSSSGDLGPQVEWVVGVGIRRGQTALFVVDWRNSANSSDAHPLQQSDIQWLTELAPLGTVLDTPVGVEDALYWTVGAAARRWVMTAQLRQVRGVWALAPARPWSLGVQGWPWIGDLQVVRDAAGHQLAGLIERAGKRDAARRKLDGASDWQWVTDTLTGLQSAAVLPQGALTVRHSGRGHEVWRAPARLPVPLPTTLAPDEPAPLYEPLAALALEHPYSPWPSLRPRTWRPVVLAVDTSVWLGARLSGRDAAGWVDASLYAQLRSDGTSPFAQLDIAVLRFEPALTLSVAYDQGNAYFRRGYFWYATPTTRMGARLGGSWSLPGLRDALSLSGGLRWRQVMLRERNYALAVDHEPSGPVPVEPGHGTDVLADVGINWRYGERYPESIRSERTHAISATVTAGSHLQTARQRWVFGLASDHAWPLGRRQVLAIAVQGALAAAAGQTEPVYAITGVQPLQALAVLGLGGPTNWTVRGAGWEKTGLGGNALAWGTLAWHFPVADVGRSLDTLPLWLGRVHGSLFCDAAWAALPAGKLRSGGLLSFGGDVALELVLGYGLGATLHVGAAQVHDGSNGGWLSLGL
ncbi:MAG: hypothetical protein EXR77_15645 [Myxococcales bacterium]|nr:hypothetical protein [Myxococcales bacterium]